MLQLSRARRRKAKPERKSEHCAEMLSISPCSRNEYEECREVMQLNDYKEIEAKGRF